MRFLEKRDRKERYLTLSFYAFAAVIFLYTVLAFIFVGYSAGGIALLLASVVLFLCGLFSRYLLKRRVFLVLLIAAVLLALGLVSFLGIFGITQSHEGRFDVVIVLGAEVKGREPSRHLKARLDTALSYLLENPDVIAVVSGGQGKGEDIPEASAMKNYLVERGIQPERILTEENSTSTFENLTFVKEVLADNGIENYRVLIVTSEYHVLRTHTMTKKLDIVASFLPAKTVWYEYPIRSVREWIAIAKLILLGC